MDAALIRRAQRGERDAVERLLSLLLPRVRRWARTHVGNGDDADDVAQRTLIKAAKGLPRFDLRSELGTWVHRILRRCVADHYRARRRRGRREERGTEAGGDPPPDPSAVFREPDLDGERTLALVRRAFLALPNRQREAFDLVDLQGLGAEEAAAEMEVAPATVRVHLHRARREIRRMVLENEPALLEERNGLRSGD